MSNGSIQTQQTGKVLTVRIHRPDKKNCLSMTMYAQLGEVFENIAGDANVRAVVITGDEASFSAGNDMKDFLAGQKISEDNVVLRFMRALAATEQPVIAAVNGLAIGIGATMLLHCDLVYLGAGTRLQFPFVNIGICPEYASTLLLPRIMGHARAAELTLFGDFFGPEKAVEYGLANAVLPAAEVEAHAVERAQVLAQKPPAALRTTKKLLKRGTEREISDAIWLEATHFIPMLGRPEAHEAVTAFMEKRKPDFSSFS